jgi:hypothetical protein
MLWTDHSSKQIRRTTDGEQQILWYALIHIRTLEEVCMAERITFNDLPSFRAQQ